MNTIKRLSDEEHDKREIERLKEMKEYYKTHSSFKERWELFMKAMRGEKEKCLDK